MKAVTVYQVDAFTNQKFKGNPAGVVLQADGLTGPEMLDIAKELNNSETAFVFSPVAGDHDVWLRFFTPAIEVPICGHATIAAHYARAVENHLGSCTIIHKTGAGILPVKIEKQGEDIRVTMTQGEISIEPPLEKNICQKILTALSLDQNDLNPACPIRIVSTGHSKVIIGIGSKGKLNGLKPDFNMLATLSREIKSNGYFVFTFDSDRPDILTHARMFAPAIGINEDPVTGNGNGPLGAYLVHHGLVDHDNRLFCFKGQQGDAMGRPGIISVEVDIENKRPVRTRVGGQAVMVFKTTIMV
ncbi:MAG: PhzF family isomerase [Desulfobacula sp.]|jgi:PhzF family phenazine biosynthesis protein